MALNRTRRMMVVALALLANPAMAATVVVPGVGVRTAVPTKAEHNLPPVIRQHVDDNDNAMVPACRTITSYLNHAANPNARTSWHAWASGNECEGLNDRVAQKDELELYHMYHVLERKDGFVCVRIIGDDVPCYWTAVANLHHIDKQRLSDAQFKKVEELNEQVSELSDLASQYLDTAPRTNDRREQKRLEDLADRAQEEADRLYDQILAIKP
jgi:hypothetical protein